MSSARPAAARSVRASDKPSSEPGLEKLALEDYFTYRLNTLNKLNDMISQGAYLASTGLSLAETRCLAAVGARTQATVNQLALEANLDKSQASRTAQSLVDRGWVVKTSAEGDARSVVLSLTPAGRRLWKKVMQQIDQRNRALLECLSAAEQQQLLDMFVRMEAHSLKGRAGATGR